MARETLKRSCKIKYKVKAGCQKGKGCRDYAANRSGFELQHSHLPAEWEEMWDGSVWPLRIWWPCSRGWGPRWPPSGPMVLPLQPAVPAFMVVSQGVFWESESRAFGTARAWTPGLTDPRFHHRPSQSPAQLGEEERFHHSSWAGLPVFRVLPGFSLVGELTFPPPCPSSCLLSNLAWVVPVNT